MANVSDLLNAQLGQYGASALDAGEIINLTGSRTHVVQAITFLADSAFEHLEACSGKAGPANGLSFSFGGEKVATFKSSDVTGGSTDTIKLSPDIIKDLKVTDTCSYIDQGLSGSALGLNDLNVDDAGHVDDAGSSGDVYYIHSIDKGANTVKFATTSSNAFAGTAVNLTVPTVETSGSSHLVHKLIFPAMQVMSNAAVKGILDSNIADDGSGTILAVGDVFPKGLTIYGRWNYVKLGSTTATSAAICYYGPKTI